MHAAADGRKLDRQSMNDDDEPQHLAALCAALEAIANATQTPPTGDGDGDQSAWTATQCLEDLPAAERPRGGLRAVCRVYKREARVVRRAVRQVGRAVAQAAAATDELESRGQALRAAARAAQRRLSGFVLSNASGEFSLQVPTDSSSHAGVDGAGGYTSFDWRAIAALQRAYAYGSIAALRDVSGVAHQAQRVAMEAQRQLLEAGHDTKACAASAARVMRTPVACLKVV
jgi:hypothetical protein